MKCTIKDIALKAGVSPSTVSRVISGNARISDETQRKIRAIMAQMNYQPNLLARSLVNRSPGAVGVFLKANPQESMKHPFFSEALRGMSTQAAQEGLYLLLASSPCAAQDLDIAKGLISSGMAGGMILLSSHQDDPVAAFLTAQQMPFVVVGHPESHKTAHWVDNDNHLAGRLATEHLIHCGHRRIMLLGSGDGYTVTQLRQAGYEEALSQAGIPIRPEWNLSDPPHQAQALVHAFQSPNAPTAVVAMDDSWALWLMGLLGENGLSVPQDVSVVGFNNSPLAPYTSPPLTSVEIHPYDLGLAAMSTLIKVLKTPQDAPQHVIVPVSLVRRGSVRTLS